MSFDPPTTQPPGLYRWTGPGGDLGIPADVFYYLDDKTQWWVLYDEWERVPAVLPHQFDNGILEFIGIPTG